MLQPRALVSLACVFLLSATASAQFVEIEPNTNKAEATLVNGIANGGTITGITTGADTTAASTLATSVDYFRVKTAPLPPGIYRQVLTLTTTGTSVPRSTIRGLTQANGVIDTASDVYFQFDVDSGSFAHSVLWYAFGKQEEIYYRVDGTVSTTAAYTSTLTTAQVTPTPIPGVFQAGTITVTTAGQGHTTDTEIYLYDANFDPVPLGHNDGAHPSDPRASTVSLPLAAGIYYVAVGRWNTANNVSDLNPTEFWDDDPLLDFPGSLVCNQSSNSQSHAFAVTDGVTTTSIAPPTNPGVGIFGMVWGQFTVVGSVPPPANDDCANAVALTGSVIAHIGGASNDGIASCDPGGAASRDVWYSFTDPSGAGGTLKLDTCGTLGVDPVLTVFSACGGVELDCNDDCSAGPCGGSSSCTSVTLSPSQTVTVRVSDRGLGGGDSVFMNVRFTPANDSCQAPLALPGPGIYAIDGRMATTGTEGQSASTCSGPISFPVRNDLWYSYTPMVSGTVEVSTCGTIGLAQNGNRDSKILVYSGVGCPAPGSMVACNDTSGLGSGSPTACSVTSTSAIVRFSVTCGATYTIQLGAGPSAGGFTWLDGQFTITEIGGTLCSTPVTSYCFGDGSGTSCPCANSGAVGNGCGSSVNANGGKLQANGIASLASDTWQLSATGVPDGPGLYFQGTTQLNGGNGNVFGDGLRCVGGSVVRLGIVLGVGNASTYPSPNPPAANAIPISVKGFLSAGNNRNYQLWYRDSGAFCTASVFNLTNAVNVIWTP